VLLYVPLKSILRITSGITVFFPPNDKTEHLPPYLECALSNPLHILNAHRATLGASMMSQEKETNAPNWKSYQIYLSLN
jgi:hypothetical protein